MTACLELDISGGGLSGKRGRAAASSAPPTFASLSASEERGVRSGVTKVALDD